MNQLHKEKRNKQINKEINYFSTYLSIPIIGSHSYEAYVANENKIRDKGKWKFKYLKINLVGFEHEKYFIIMFKHKNCMYVQQR